jgi:hypothetical protein
LASFAARPFDALDRLVSVFAGAGVEIAAGGGGLGFGGSAHRNWLMTKKSAAPPVAAINIFSRFCICC